MSENTATLVGNFNFRVTLRRSIAGESGAPGPLKPSPSGALLGEGGFQECSGLEVEMDVQELVEGGRNDGVIKRVGRGKYAPVVLKRGMFVGKGDQVNADLWAWLQGILTGRRPVVRYDGVIEVLSHVGNRDEQAAVVRAKWVFLRGLPQKVSGPALNAKNGDVAMEELHIAHEGLHLELG